MMLSAGSETFSERVEHTCCDRHGGTSDAGSAELPAQMIWLRISGNRESGVKSELFTLGIRAIK